MSLKMEDEAVVASIRLDDEQRHRAALYAAGMWADRHTDNPAEVLDVTGWLLDMLGLNERPLRSPDRGAYDPQVCAGCGERQLIHARRMCNPCYRRVYQPSRKKLVTCARCGREGQPHYGRGLCGTCHRRELRTEQKEQTT